MSTENYYSERYTLDPTLISLIPKSKKKTHVKFINGNSDADCSSSYLEPFSNVHAKSGFML